ncbi:VOC family protein [Streptomyces sp. NPDC048516]|uniref:VOC family protein n=1 Tax=Streptomyces sp. NPDC048516 TaxID=3365565 RepID=UPI00371F3BB5
MTSLIRHTTILIRHTRIDCTDAYRLASFRAQVLDGTPAEDDLPGDPEATVTATGGTLLFVTAPDPRAGKNRVHLDLQPQDRSRDEEVERLLALGATPVADHRRADGAGWVTPADIEGNEFCVERSAAERAGWPRWLRLPPVARWLWLPRWPGDPMARWPGRRPMRRSPDAAPSDGRRPFSAASPGPLG